MKISTILRTAQTRALVRTATVLSALLLVSVPAWSETTESDTRNWGVVPLPIIAYTPDTGGMFGAAAIFFYGPDVGVPEEQRQGYRNNTAAANAIVTTNGSWIGAVSGTNYLAEERYRWDNAIYGSRAPGVFFGVGDEASDMEQYRAETVGGETRFSVQLLPDLFVGPLYQFERSTILETDDEGLLAGAETGAEDITGSDGTTRLSGPGVSVIRDTTGGVFWPRGGATTSAEIRSFSRVTGSSTNFGLYRVRHVHYIPTTERHVLALQGRFRGSWGDVPFQHLPSIGGDGVNRGILDGRYRDTVAAIAGAEYRIALSERFAVVGFGSVGQVGSDILSLDLTKLRGTGGIGFRVALNKEQRVNLRIDIAFASSGIAPYIGMGEAF